MLVISDSGFGVGVPVAVVQAVTKARIKKSSMSFFMFVILRSYIL